MARATIAPTPPRKRRVLYPNWENEKGRLRRRTARMVYREDTKGSAAHSVRDRLTALLAKQVCLMNADWPIPINLAAKPPMGVALPPRGAGAALAPALFRGF